MGKVTLIDLVPDNSPIYDQALIIGGLITSESLKNSEMNTSGTTSIPLDLNNLPFDPAEEALKKSSLEKNKNKS